MQDMPDFDPATTREAYDAALSLVRASRMTDVELIYTPSQIALACFHRASPSLAEQWINAKSPQTGNGESLLDVIRDIQQVIEHESGAPEVEVVRGIDKRLKICTNPEKVVGSKA